MVLEEFLMKSVTWIAYGCTWILTGLYMYLCITGWFENVADIVFCCFMFLFSIFFSFFIVKLKKVEEEMP